MIRLWPRRRPRIQPGPELGGARYDFGVTVGRKCAYATVVGELQRLDARVGRGREPTFAEVEAAVLSLFERQGVRPPSPASRPAS